MEKLREVVTRTAVPRHPTIRENVAAQRRKRMRFRALGTGQNWRRAYVVAHALDAARGSA
jgi:hypothetical protein